VAFEKQGRTPCMVSETDSHATDYCRSVWPYPCAALCAHALPARNKWVEGSKSRIDNAGHDDNCSELHVGGGF